MLPRDDIDPRLDASADGVWAEGARFAQHSWGLSLVSHSVVRAGLGSFAGRLAACCSSQRRAERAYSASLGHGESRHASRVFCGKSRDAIVEAHAKATRQPGAGQRSAVRAASLG